MEYDALVNFYVDKLRERYQACDPERRRIMELLRHADEDTISRVAALLEIQDSKKSMGNDAERDYRQEEKDNNPFPKKLTSPTNVGKY